MRWFREGGPGSLSPWKIMERFTVPWEEDPSQAHFVRYRIVQTPWFGLYAHRFDNPDTRTFHDHPWNFVSIVLRGGYVEATPRSRSGVNHRMLQAGSINFKRATQLHYVTALARKPTWTLMAVGRRQRVWGFVEHGEWTRWDTYLQRKREERDRAQ